MNYITHLNKILERFNSDPRLNSKHVSLYMALFRQWNYERFPTWIYIRRKEIMSSSKIGSSSTYHRVIKDLNNWKYVTYIPSFLMDPSSKIKMFGMDEKGLPLEIQPPPEGSSLMGRPRPIVEQPTIYNKHKNIKKAFIEKKEALKNAFEKEKMGSNSGLQFLRWLEKAYSEEELLKANWESLFPVWKKEQQLEGTKNKKVESHFEDNLKISKGKRYDQPL